MKNDITVMTLAVAWAVCFAIAITGGGALPLLAASGVGTIYMVFLVVSGWPKKGGGRNNE